MGNALYLELDASSSSSEEEHAADTSAGVGLRIERPHTLLEAEEQLEHVLRLLYEDILQARNLQRRDPHPSAATQEEQMRLLNAILVRTVRLIEEIEFQDSIQVVP